jgi:Domain of unknown function (DUF4352)
MATLIFFASIITAIILVIKVIIKIVKQESCISTFKAIAIVVLAYCLLWIVFYFKSTNKPVPLGTDICFDDWCATVMKVEQPKFLGQEKMSLNPHGQFFVLHIKMSNHARGIAQKPSEPRVHLVDEQGYIYAFSKEGQQALEDSLGKQIPIDEKLELHQSLETQLVFDIPKDAKKVYALIEEGPFITELLFHDDKEIFVLQ